jgi:hypothetical protein
MLIGKIVQVFSKVNLQVAFKKQFPVADSGPESGVIGRRAIPRRQKNP